MILDGSQAGHAADHEHTGTNPEVAPALQLVTRRWRAERGLVDEIRYDRNAVGGDTILCHDYVGHRRAVRHDAVGETIGVSVDDADRLAAEEIGRAHV